MNYIELLKFKNEIINNNIILITIIIIVISLIIYTMISEGKGEQ